MTTPPSGWTATCRSEYNDCTDTEACEEAESCYEESEYDARGFDNCDLETIVNIVDTNIMPNVTGLLGDTSDEDMTAASALSSHRSSMPSR